MYQDVSLIPSDWNCYVLGNNVITAYSSGGVLSERRQFYKFGEKWYQGTRTTNVNIPTGSVCHDFSELTTLPSSSDYSSLTDHFLPIYHTMAIVSAIAIFYFAYKLIIYPFWRKR